MSGNYIEELISEYYKLRGYFVMNNYWFQFQSERQRTVKGKIQKYLARSWTDIDVIAINSKELLLIQVKTSINRENIIDGIKKFFKRVDAYLETGLARDNESDIKWWTNGRKIKKMVIFEHCANKYRLILEEAGIEAKNVSEFIDEIIEYVKDNKGVKEDSPMIRFLHYIYKLKK